jgi:5-methylcytosine-specific restriction endonuclease McrA
MKNTKTGGSAVEPYLKSAGKIKKEKTSTLRNKADKLYQELGRLNYKDCLICGGEYSCLHHYHPKSTSTALRYDLENGINICAGCHLKHHTGNPDIQNTINSIKGLDWVEEMEWRKFNIKVKPNNEWYKVQIEILQTMINAFK